jgi:hypothetical protein
LKLIVRVEQQQSLAAPGCCSSLLLLEEVGQLRAAPSPTSTKLKRRRNYAGAPLLLPPSLKLIDELSKLKRLLRLWQREMS